MPTRHLFLQSNYPLANIGKIDVSFQYLMPWTHRGFNSCMTWPSDVLNTAVTSSYKYAGKNGKCRTIGVLMMVSKPININYSSALLFS